MADRHSIPYFTALLLSLAVFTGLVRFAMAPVTSLELRGDVLLFEIWGQSAREHGLLNVYTTPIYDEQYGRVALPNYLPPYLYVVWAASHVHHWFAPSELVGDPTRISHYKNPSHTRRRRAPPHPRFHRQASVRGAVGIGCCCALRIHPVHRDR